MGLRCGIIGLPNVGKSTIFNALTRSEADIANYPFTTIDANVGIVSIPDFRLERIGALIPNDKLIFAAIEFVDVAGLVKGASQGEGLGNQFLSRIMEMDALAHVVRCFDEGNVAHVSGSIAPARDIEIVAMELVLKDLEMVQKKIARLEKLTRAGDKKAAAEIAVLTKVTEGLGQGTAVRDMSLSEEERHTVSEMTLLTDKPVVLVANVDEEAVAEDNEHVREVREIASARHAGCIKLCGKLEEELSKFEGEERQEMMKAMGLQESGLRQLITAGSALLNLVTFFTTQSRELRAWTVVHGTKAPAAAGQIHTDFEKGFIKAEVIAFDDLDATSSEAVAREKGLMRIEGKEYVVQDGDVIHFRFSS